MYFRLTIKTDYDAVFTVNGSFTEARRPLSLRRDEVYYITVYPLCAVFLPYTVKIAGGKVASNLNLASVYELDGKDFALKLLPRYAYVLFSDKEHTENDLSLPVKFFSALRNGEISSARAMLTAELSSSVDDNALASFFEGFTDIVENEGKFFLVDGHGKGSLYRFILKANLIDDITEE